MESVNQKTSTRTEVSISISMNLLKAMGCLDKLSEKDIDLIRSCFSLVADASSLDERTSIRSTLPISDTTLNSDN